MSSEGQVFREIHHEVRVSKSSSQECSNCRMTHPKNTFCRNMSVLSLALGLQTLICVVCVCRVCNSNLRITTCRHYRALQRVEPEANSANPCRFYPLWCLWAFRKLLEKIFENHTFLPSLSQSLAEVWFVWFVWCFSCWSLASNASWLSWLKRVESCKLHISFHITCRVSHRVLHVYITCVSQVSLRLMARHNSRCPCGPATWWPRLRRWRIRSTLQRGRHSETQRTQRRQIFCILMYLMYSLWFMFVIRSHTS